MNGQFSIFDLDDKKRPCDYRFQRYIGQRVELLHGIKGAIINIQRYYTEVLGDDGRLYAGTPSTCCPEEER